MSPTPPYRNRHSLQRGEPDSLIRASSSSPFRSSTAGKRVACRHRSTPLRQPGDRDHAALGFACRPYDRFALLEDARRQAVIVQVTWTCPAKIRRIQSTFPRTTETYVTSRDCQIKCFRKSERKTGFLRKASNRACVQHAWAVSTDRDFHPLAWTSRQRIKGRFRCPKRELHPARVHLGSAARQSPPAADLEYLSPSAHASPATRLCNPEEPASCRRGLANAARSVDSLSPACPPLEPAGCLAYKLGLHWPRISR